MNTERISRIMLTLLLMGVFFASFRVSETLANPTVRFYVKMPPEGYIPGVAPGSPVIVEVWIDSPPGAGILGWSLSLQWNPAVLELGYTFVMPLPLPPIYYDIVEGPWLSDWCAAYPWPYGTSFLKGAIDKEAGTVTLPACMINSWLELPPGSGADGTGCLAYFYFTSLSETDYSPLDLIEADCVYATTEGVWPVDIVEDGHYNPPPVYNLTVESTPIDGVDFTVDSASYATNATVESAEGDHTVTMPDPWMVGMDQYKFVKWEDDSTDRVRTINLTSNTTITATYELTKEYTLTVNSIPITGINFTVDETTHTTNWAGPLLEGPYTVAMPSTWTVGSDIYIFRYWEDSSTDALRTISLTADKTIVATYEFVEVRPPVAVIEAPSEEYVNEAVTFDGSQSYDPDGGSIVSYRWNFGDGDIISTTNSTIVHTYATIGTYEVTLVVTDDENQESDPTKHEIRIKGPIEGMQELIENIESWNLHIGTENSLTSKLEEAIHLLNMGNENGAIHKLIGFIDKVEALRSKGKLEDWQADHLITEAQTIISII